MGQILPCKAPLTSQGLGGLLIRAAGFVSAADLGYDAESPSVRNSGEIQSSPLQQAGGEVGKGDSRFPSSSWKGSAESDASCGGLQTKVVFYVRGASCVLIDTVKAPCRRVLPAAFSPSLYSVPESVLADIWITHTAEPLMAELPQPPEAKHFSGTAFTIRNNS